MKKKLEVAAVGIGGLVLYTLAMGIMLFINALILVR